MTRSPATRRFGELLRAGRKAKGHGQDVVAKKFGTTQPTVCRWEQGWLVPDLDTLLGLATEYGFSLSDLAVAS